MTQGIVCNACGGRTAAIARKCVHCGARVDVGAASRRAHQEVGCPQCGEETGVVSLCGIEIDSCAGCGGAWFDRSELDRFAEGLTDEQIRENAREILALPPPARTSNATAVRYWSCPVCRTRMTRRNYRSVSGVIVDSCDAHGCWLERDDLNHLLTVLADEGLEEIERRAQAVRLERERERVLHLEERAQAAEDRLRRSAGSRAWLPIYLGW